MVLANALSNAPLPEEEGRIEKMRRNECVMKNKLLVLVVLSVLCLSVVRVSAAPIKSDYPVHCLELSWCKQTQPAQKTSDGITPIQDFIKLIMRVWARYSYR